MGSEACRLFVVKFLECVIQSVALTKWGCICNPNLSNMHGALRLYRELFFL